MKNSILDALDPSNKVILYPSSCAYSDDFQQVPFDAIILNSYEMRLNERRGKVYCFKFDNNELLGMLAARRLRLAAVVIIRDGCSEGGNYECAAGYNFFGRVLPVVNDEFEYFCDHNFSQDVPARFREMELPDYMQPFIVNSGPRGRVRAFRVTPVRSVERNFILGRIRMEIVRDTIWRELNAASILVVKTDRAIRSAVPNYLKGLQVDSRIRDNVECVTQTPITSIRPYLELALDRKKPRLAIMPIGKGSYENIAAEIRAWEKEYPSEIGFYHLNATDFRYFKRMSIDSNASLQ
jgi:hypothetical protein